MNGFTPDIGNLVRYRVPSGRSVRVDDAFVEGMDIPIYYDPMISKLIVWDRDRASALQRLKEALADYHIGGVTTNAGFLYNLAGSAAFQAAELDTGFIGRHQAELFKCHVKSLGLVGNTGTPAELASGGTRILLQCDSK